MSVHTFSCLDGHTCGNPVRLVSSGAPLLKGATMSERRLDFLAKHDWIRKALMFEPRGHDVMSGSMLYAPTRADCDVGILFIEVSGCLPMCGHDTIAACTVLLETGILLAKEPVTELVLDTPAGIVRAQVEVGERGVKGVTFQNVPAFLFVNNRLEGNALETLRAMVAELPFLLKGADVETDSQKAD